MSVHPSSSNASQRLVIFIITCALLWTQFFGLNHSIHHSWKATTVALALTQQSLNEGDFTQQGLNIGLSNKSSPNTSSNHNCFAWDSCSLNTAVFLSNQLQLTSFFVFFLSPLKSLPSFSYQLTQYFLSRAPPKLTTR